MLFNQGIHDYIYNKNRVRFHKQTQLSNKHHKSFPLLKLIQQRQCNITANPWLCHFHNKDDVGLFTTYPQKAQTGCKQGLLHQNVSSVLSVSIKNNNIRFMTMSD